MPDYEVLTTLSNGKKKPHAIGATVTLDSDDATYLVTAGALRLVPGQVTEKGGEPIGTAQRVAAAGTAGEPQTFLTAAAAMRAELAGKSHKALDAIIKDEEVGEIPAKGGKPTVAEKVEAIVASRTGKFLAGFNREGLIGLSASVGYADLDALDLAHDAAEDEIRASLMRVAAAQAD